MEYDKQRSGVNIVVDTTMTFVAFVFGNTRKNFTHIQTHNTVFSIWLIPVLYWHDSIVQIKFNCNHSNTITV